jgi:hypothetical protein
MVAVPSDGTMPVMLRTVPGAASTDVKLSSSVVRAASYTNAFTADPE